MRFAIFGDVHGNLESLEMVVDAARRLSVDTFVCLGDTVGYGANPNECVCLVRDIGALTVAGNHDHAVLGGQNLNYFNHHARDAILWTRNHLSDESRAWLAGLSLVEHLEAFSVVNGSLQSPEAFNYVQTLKDAELNFRLMETNLLFLGHSHYPLAFFHTTPPTYTVDPIIPLNPSLKTIVNVGSVGQPRDEDPRASFAVYDTVSGMVEIHRVEYQVERAVEKILRAGLPQALAMRLALGK